MSPRPWSLALACVLLHAGAGLAMAAPPDPRAPAAEARPKEPPPASVREAAVGPGAVLARALLFVYQRGAGPSKGHECPMSPSCSEYARLAVAKHGVVPGVLMAADRLHRCGHDIRFYPVVASLSGAAKSYDPPE